MGYDRDRQFTDENRNFVRRMARAVRPYVHNHTGLRASEVDDLGRSWTCAWVDDEHLARWAAMGASFLMDDMHLPGKTVEEVSAALEKLISEYDEEAREEGYTDGSERYYYNDSLARARAWLQAGNFAYWLVSYLVEEAAADTARDSALSYVESNESSNDVKKAASEKFDTCMKVFAETITDASSSSVSASAL